MCYNSDIMATKKTTLDYFDPAFIQKQRKELEKTEKRLLRKNRQLSKFPDIGNSPDDTAQEASEFASNTALKDNIVSEQLTQVQAALKRIEKGTYGICLKTGRPIEKGRLEAIPEAEFAADVS